MFNLMHLIIAVLCLVTTLAMLAAGNVPLALVCGSAATLNILSVLDVARC